MRISRKLFMYIMFMLLGFAVLILLSNTLALSPLNHWSVKNNMLSAMDEYKNVYSKDNEDWLTEVEEMAKDEEFGMMVRNEDESLFSSAKEFGIQARPGETFSLPRSPDRFILEGQGENSETLEDGTHIGTYVFPDDTLEMVICSYTFDDNTRIILTQSIAPITESVKQANILLLGCTIFSLLILVFVVFGISKLFTKPIMQIQQTVEHITALNFDEKCTINTGDELQSLGDDVNILSEKLENALNELQEKNEKLKSDIEAQKRFIANASHELRTPLSLIKGYSDEMVNGYIDSLEKNQTYSKIIADEANKMKRLLSEMLELSRMQSGQIKLKNEEIDVNEQLKEFLEKYDGFIQENELNVTLATAENAAGYFDPMRFEQILANYVSNAARYSDDKKIIKISVEVMESNIRIRVFNSGNHIDREKINNIWEGFYKIDNSRTREDGSYGLGLSIVKAIQNVAGCKFGAYNKLGGVEFWFDVQKA